MIAREILQQIGRLKGLKTIEQRLIDYLIDKLMYILFSSWSHLVLGGGTCINRFYGGERFSRDIDIYLEKRINLQLVVDELKREGIIAELSKGIIREKFESYYFDIKLLGENVIIKIDLMGLPPGKYTKTLYESMYPDVAPVIVNILNIDVLLTEKIKALLSEARWKVADVYDIYFICRKYRLEWKKFCEPRMIDVVKKRAKYLIKRDWQILEDTLLENIGPEDILRCFE